VKVAVLGGGQLGRMMALHGVPLGATFVFLEPGVAPPAGQVGSVVQAPYGDAAALEAVASSADVVTYEFENVPVDAARRLESTVPVRPPPAALELAQDRLVEKQGFRSVGIPTPAFHPVDDAGDIEGALALTGLPAVAKTRRFGYDGKGQAVVKSADEAREFVEARGPGLIFEAFVPFDRELSIIAVAGLEGERLYYPLTENHHHQGILRFSYAPAPGLAESVRVRAEAYAEALIDHLGYVGVMAIEFFQVGEDLLANEMAPRVHNSGHWTQDGAAVSQFENHVRAVLGLPLGDTSARGYAAMVNLIGHVPRTGDLLNVPGAHLHLYGKRPRPGRKLGHVNVVGGDVDEVMAGAARIARHAGWNGPLPALRGGG